MKKTLKKSLALLLALVMCVGLLPVTALAAGGGSIPTGTPTVTIQDTPMLIKGDYQYQASDRTPFLSFSWSYGDFSLPDGEVWSATVYAWAGTETTRPANYWYNNTIDATGSGGSFHGKLAKSQGSEEPSEIYSNCMVMVELNYNGNTYSATKQGVATVENGTGYQAPVDVTISGTPTLSGSSSPSLSVSWNYSEMLSGDYSGMIFAWRDDGNSGTMPQNYWFQEFTDGDGGTSDSTTVSLRKTSDSTEALEGDYWVQVRLGLSAQANVESEPVKVSVGGSSGDGASISGTPTLTAGTSPTLSVDWSYSSALTTTDKYYARLYAWAGTSSTRPESTWWKTIGSNSSESGIVLTSNGGSVTEAELSQKGNPNALSGTCTVQVEIVDGSANVLALSNTVQVTAQDNSSGGGNVHLPTPSNNLPVIEEVAYYDKDYSYLLAYPDTYHGYPAAWYLYTEGSNNLEVFALLPAASQEAANSASVSGYSGFQTDGQWYSVAGFWTVDPNTADLMDKDGTHRALMTPLYCGNGTVPAQGTTLYLSLWDYDNSGMSNLVPVTVPGTGETASAEALLEPHPTITTSSLDNGSVLSAYTATLTGSAVNSGALSWSATGLPGGLTCSGAGVISGTPTESGTFSVTVTLTEAGVEKTSSKTFLLKVTGASPTINTTALAEATWGVAYSASLSGTPAKQGAELTWSLDEGSDALPGGLTLSGNGTISGTAAQGTEGSYSLKFKLSEAGSDKTATTTLTFKVKAPTGPNITINANLPNAKAKLSYSLPLAGTASVLGGTLSWSLAEGSSLPDGLSLAADGTLSGTPAEAAIQAEAYSFTVVLTETKGDFTLTATKTLYLTVVEPDYYNVYFYLNGGTIPEGHGDDYVDKTGLLEGSSVTLPAAVTRTGYDFTGWSVGGTLYQPGATLTLGRTLYVYARFEAKPATQMVYNGPQLLGSVCLVGTYTYNDHDYPATITLDSDYKNTLYTPQLEIAAYNLNRNYTGFGLYTYVDGKYTKVAEYAGAIAEGTASVTLTTVDGLSLAPVTAVSAAGLTSGTDYSVGSIRVSGHYVSLPFLTNTNGTATFRVELSGVSSSANYDKYQWTTYDATLNGSTLSVTPATVPDGVSISGAVTFGGQPMAGVQVQVHQHVYGQDRNRIAVTGSDGKFTVTELLGGEQATIQVLSAAQSLYYESGYNIAANAVKDIAVTKAPLYISTELDLDASVAGLTAAQRSTVQQELNWTRLNIAFTEDGIDRGSGMMWAGNTQYCYAQAVSQTSTIRYEISHDYFETVTGDIRLANGFGSAAVKLQPRAAVLASITAPAYGYFYLAWFDSAGAYQSSQYTPLTNGTKTFLAPCPGDSGSYTLVLLSSGRYKMLTRETTLASIPESERILTWTVSLAAHEIKAVSGTVTQAASDNALYVTQPNSTMTADRESFATTGDLVRFTGAIGLDDDLTGGKLTYVTIYPTNVTDNVSWSNSAVLQYMVIDGKLYTPDQGHMASIGYYYFYVNAELPCTYTLYCKPGSLDWDMQMNMNVSVTFNGGSEGSQPVGSATVKKPGASITTLSSYVCSDQVYVNGTARPNETVSIYDGETLVGAATTDGKGLWGAKVPLANTDSAYASTHILTSRTDKAQSEDLYVFHDPNGPELTSFRMSWEENGSPYGINMGDGYVFHGKMEQVTFTAVFKNPEKLRATIYGDANETSKVAFVYYLTNGTIATVYGSDQGGGVFTATLPGTLYSSVTAADVLYDPILNSRPSRDGTYAFTDTDLAEYKDNLDAAMSATLFSNDVDLSYTADAQDLTAINEKYVGTGMEVRNFAVEYDDETGFLKWLNDSAAEWTSGNPEANSVGIYNKSVVFAKKADYDAQLAQLKAYATWQSALENKESSVTGVQFFFTDMEYDGDLNLTNEGTYLAEFNAFCDTDRGLFTIIGALALDSSFQRYATELPNHVATLTTASGGGDLKLLWYWGNESSKENVSTTEKALMKYVEGGGIEKLFEQGPPNPVEIYHNIYDSGSEYINTTSDAEKQALGARIDAYNIENSKEWQELKNAKDYYDRINPYSSFRSSSVELDSSAPTIGDRMDQINKDIAALKAIDGKLPSMDAKFALEMMKSFQDIADLGSAMTGGADINPVCPVFKFLQDVPGIICDKMTMDQIQERMDIYNRLMYNWNYVQNWYNSEIGFGDERFAPKENNGGGDSSGGTGGGGGQGGSGGSQGGSGGSGGQGGSGGTGGGVQDDTGTSSGSRAREIADQSKTRKPPISNKVSNDPSGIVFEGVIENPVEGALVTLYYAADPTGAVVKQTDDLTTATQLLQAEGVDDLIPAASTWITGPDGRYAWGVPEGLWFVTAAYGGLTGNSNGDNAATVNTALGDATKLLPVLPVQLEVNIPLTDAAAPIVTDVILAEGEGVYVTFSKYMQEGEGSDSCLNPANYTLSVNDAPNTSFTVTAIEQGHVPANLTGAGTTYTKIVRLNVTDLAVGDEIALTAAGTLCSYAGTAMGTAFSAFESVETQTKLDPPTAKINSESGDAVTAAKIGVDRGNALILTQPAGAPASAKILYQIGVGAQKIYDPTAPIIVNNDMTLTFWCEAPGYIRSDEKTLEIICGSLLPKLTADTSALSMKTGAASTVTTTLTDDAGLPIAGGTVVASSSDGSIATVTASAVTDAGGKASFTVTAVKAGSAALSFNLDNAAVSITVSVTVTDAVINDPQPAAVTETVKVTGEEELTATPTVKKGKAEVEIKEKLAANALKDADAGDTLTVKVETKNADSVTTRLPAKTVQTVANADVDVRIETENGTVKLPAETVDALAETGREAAIGLTDNGDGSMTVSVSAGGEPVEAKLKVELPVADDGQVLVIVQPDGTEEIVKKSVVEDGVVYVELPAGATVKLADNAKTFPDVPEDAWYADEVEFVSSHGLFEGTNKGFEPTATMTRAMLATVLYRLEDAAATGENPFADVEDGKWYTEAVTWANSAGIVEGTGSGFAPNAPITREQIATMLYRYANYLGLDTTGRAALDGFPDGDQTASWASEAMQWAVCVGLFQGNANGTLNPKGNATRAEVAALLERMIKLIVK